jgi:hypothetical protein
MRSSIRATAAAALLAVSGTAFSFDLTPPSVVLAPGGSFSNSIITDGSAEELFTFFWSGAAAFVTLSSTPNPLASYSFASWSWGSCGADCTAPNRTPINTGSFPGSAPTNGPVGFATSPTSYAAGTYYYTFSGSDLSTTNNLTTALSLTTSIPMAPIPEPSTYALMLAGLGVVGFLARRRKSASTGLAAA